MYRRAAKGSNPKRYRPAHYVPRLLGIVTNHFTDDRTSCLTTSACCSLATPNLCCSLATLKAPLVERIGPIDLLSNALLLTATPSRGISPPSSTDRSSYYQRRTLATKAKLTQRALTASKGGRRATTVELFNGKVNGPNTSMSLARSPYTHHPSLARSPFTQVKRLKLSLARSPYTQSPGGSRWLALGQPSDSSMRQRPSPNG